MYVRCLSLFLSLCDVALCLSLSLSVPHTAYVAFLLFDTPHLAIDTKMKIVQKFHRIEINEEEEQ